MTVPAAWPPALTEDLGDILGMMCFQLGPLAHVYREVGEFVGVDGLLKSRAEDEQAFMLHKFVAIWFEHGSNWREAAGVELQRVASLAKAKTS